MLTFSAIAMTMPLRTHTPASKGNHKNQSAARTHLHKDLRIEHAYLR